MNLFRGRLITIFTQTHRGFYLQSIVLCMLTCIMQPVKQFTAGSEEVDCTLLYVVPAMSPKWAGRIT